jgi:hypothetical protein
VRAKKKVSIIKRLWRKSWENEVLTVPSRLVALATKNGAELVCK